MKRHEKEHTFSVELKSKSQLGVEMPKKSDDLVLVEGTLGQLLGLRIVESAMLEIEGSTGILRVDLNVEDLAQVLGRKQDDGMYKTMAEGDD